MKTWTLIALLARALTAAAAAGTAGDKLTMLNGYIFTDVTLNGHGPYRMMVDTGASSCSVAPEIASQAGLTFDTRVIMGTATGEKIVPASSNARIAVGGTESAAEVVAMNVDGIRAVDRHAVGALGQSFLGKHPYLIDYRTKRMWIGEEAVRLAERLPGPIAAERILGRMVIPVALQRDSRRWRLALDSGASRLVVRCGNRCPMVSNVSAGRVVTNAGEGLVKQGTLNDIEVGGIPVRHGGATLLEAASEGSQEDGLLPACWFAAVFVDGEKNEVRLERR